MSLFPPSDKEAGEEGGRRGFRPSVAAFIVIAILGAWVVAQVPGFVRDFVRDVASPALDPLGDVAQMFDPNAPTATVSFGGNSTVNLPGPSQPGLRESWGILTALFQGLAQLLTDTRVLVLLLALSLVFYYVSTRRD